MIALTPIVELLAERLPGFDGHWFRTVDGGAEYAQIRQDALPLPAAWVIRGADKVRHAGERAEDTTFVFDIVIAIANVRRDGRNGGDEELQKYRRAVKSLLLGWQMADADGDLVRPIVFNGGRVLEYTEGDIYWADNYSFNALVTNYLDDPQPYEQLNHTGETL